MAAMIIFMSHPFPKNLLPQSSALCEQAAWADEAAFAGAAQVCGGRERVRCQEYRVSAA
jgi:hypothetical protein